MQRFENSNVRPLFPELAQNEVKLPVSDNALALQGRMTSLHQRLCYTPQPTKESQLGKVEEAISETIVVPGMGTYRFVYNHLIITPLALESLQHHPSTPHRPVDTDILRLHREETPDFYRYGLTSGTLVSHSEFGAVAITPDKEPVRFSAFTRLLDQLESQLEA